MEHKCRVIIDLKITAHFFLTTGKRPGASHVTLC